MTSRRPPNLVHPLRVALVAVVALAASALAAWGDPVADWELRLTEWLNGLPDAVAALLWPVMQLGSVIGALVAGAFVFAWRRELRYAIVTAAAGLVAWVAAKAVKEIAQRGRPLAYLPDVDVREGLGTGLGYVSGHSAVAATCAVMVAAVLPARRRWIPALLAALVGVARVVHGVHLPADIVGGWALGALVGVFALQLHFNLTKERSGPTL